MRERVSVCVCVCGVHPQFLEAESDGGVHSNLIFIKLGRHEPNFSHGTPLVHTCGNGMYTFLYACNDQVAGKNWLLH